jgi:hypothetical protein
VSRLLVVSVALHSRKPETSELPPPNYGVRDDIPFYPAGSEFKLSKQILAMEEYKLREQRAVSDDNQDEIDGDAGRRPPE